MGSRAFKRIVPVLFAAAAAFVSASQAAGEVSLIRASSRLMVNDTLRADSATAVSDTSLVQSTYFLIHIKNIAYMKAVSVWVRNDTAWDSLGAGWIRQADDDYEYWELRKDWSRKYGPSVGAPRDLEFKVQYIEGKQMYWDDNNGRNYKLARNGGTLLGKVNVHFRAAQWAKDTGEFADTTVFSGQVEVKGWKPGSILKISYTPDNLKTLASHFIPGTPTPTWVGSSALPDSEKVYVHRFNVSGIRPPYSKGPTLHFSFTYADTTGRMWKDNNNNNTYAIGLGEKLEDLLYEELPLPAALGYPSYARPARKSARGMSGFHSSPVFNTGSHGMVDGIGRSR